MTFYDNQNDNQAQLLFSEFFVLTLFGIGFFGAAHGWGEERGKKTLLLNICHTYPAMMKLGTVIPYLKEIKKMYESRNTSLELTSGFFYRKSQYFTIPKNTDIDWILILISNSFNFY